MKAILIWFAAVLLLLAGMLASCKKEKEGAQDLTQRDKLLGTWRRTLRATDHNNNHVIEPSEVTKAPATDTLFFTLVPDATYTRNLFYKGIGYPERGTWHLQSGDADIVTQPTTSTSRVDTFKFDSLSQEYFRFHTAYPGSVWKWEAYIRP